MAVPGDEHYRTLAFAEIALEQIRALAQPATPRNFEIWYHYATGYKPALNQAINETLAQKARSAKPNSSISTTPISAPSRTGEQIDSVGTRVIDEIKQVMNMIDAAAGSATSYSESLADASDEARTRQRRQDAARRHRASGPGRQGDGAEQQESRSPAVGLEAGNRTAPGKSRGRPQRKPDRSADIAVRTANSSTARWPR